MRDSETYLPLLNFLNAQHYSKPMDPTACPEPDSWYSRGELEERRKSCGKSLKKSNHGLTHHVRSMAYIEPVIHYLETWGSPDIRAKLAEFLGEGEQRIKRIRQLTIAMAFSSISRDSEISRERQIAVYEYYHQRNGERFEQLYKVSQRSDESKREPIADDLDDAPADIKALFTETFTDETEFKQIQRSLVAMGDPKNTDISHIIINLAHKLDLARCYRGSKAQREIEGYMHTLSDEDLPYGEAMHGLRTFAIDLMHNTGNRVAYLRHGYDAETFERCNTDPAACLAEVNRRTAYDPHLHTIPVADQAPFYFKIERHAYNHEGFRHFAHMRSKINYDDFTTRQKSRWATTPDQKRKPFGVRLEKGEYTVVDNFTKSPLLPTQDKRTKKTSLSYCDTSRGYWATPTTAASKNVQVGIKLRPEQVTPSVIYSSNANTKKRTLSDFATSDKALDFLYKAQRRFHILKTAPDLITHSTTQDAKGKSLNNEILGRFSDIDSICIFRNNLQSRLMAQVRAKQWHESALEYADEMDVIGPTSPPDISFYCVTTDGTPPKQGRYDDAQQLADLEIAQSIVDSEVIAYCLAELAKPAPPSFMEKNAVHAWHYAAAHNDAATLSSLLTEDPTRLTEQDKLQRTPLHYAAANASKECLLLLIQQHVESTTAIEGFPLDLLIQHHEGDLLKQLFATVNSEQESLLVNAISPTMQQHTSVEALCAESRIREASSWKTEPDLTTIAFCIKHFDEQRLEAYFSAHENDIFKYVQQLISDRDAVALNTAVATLFQSSNTRIYRNWHSKLGFCFPVVISDEATEAKADELSDDDLDGTSSYHAPPASPGTFNDRDTIAFIKQLDPQAAIALIKNYDKLFFRGFKTDFESYILTTQDSAFIEYLSQADKAMHKQYGFFCELALELMLFPSSFEELCLISRFTWPKCEEWNEEVISEIFGDTDRYHDDGESDESFATVRDDLTVKYNAYASRLTYAEKEELIASLQNNLTDVYSEDYTAKLITVIRNALYPAALHVETAEAEFKHTPALFQPVSEDAATFSPTSTETTSTTPATPPPL